MRKKLTITVNEAVYDGLYRTIGPGRISRHALLRESDHME